MTPSAWLWFDTKGLPSMCKPGLHSRNKSLIITLFFPTMICCGAQLVPFLFSFTLCLTKRIYVWKSLDGIGHAHQCGEWWVAVPESLHVDCNLFPHVMLMFSKTVGKPWHTPKNVHHFSWGYNDQVKERAASCSSYDAHGAGEDEASTRASWMVLSHPCSHVILAVWW